MSAPSAPLELYVSRVFDAPRELVFKAWTDPQRVIQWWGPEGFTTPECDMDLRPGGTWRLAMVNDANGSSCWLRCVYRDIVEPERIVCSWCWEGDPDTLAEWVPGGQQGHETVLTVTFAEFDGGRKTRLTVHQAVFESEPARNIHREGWTSGFDRLARFISDSVRSVRKQKA